MVLSPVTRRSSTGGASGNGNDQDEGGPALDEQTWSLQQSVLSVLRLCEGLPLHDESAMAEVYTMARRMLSEEAVRCAMAIIQVSQSVIRHIQAQLGVVRVSAVDSAQYRYARCCCLLIGQCRTLTLSKPDREKMRAMWRTILDKYLRVGAPWPVSLSVRRLRRVRYVLEKSIRREVLFPDDCMAVRTELGTVRSRAHGTATAGSHQPIQSVSCSVVVVIITVCPPAVVMPVRYWSAWRPAWRPYCCAMPTTRTSSSRTGSNNRSRCSRSATWT